MIETAVRALLMADAVVAGLVAGRIYPLRLPQGPSQIMPAVVYQQVSATTEYGVAKVVGPNRVRLQVTAWARDVGTASGYDKAKAVALAVRQALEGRSAEVSGETVVGIFFRGGRDMPFEKDEPTVFGYSEDFEVVHKAALAA